MSELSIELFYGMILSGAKEVISNEQELNQLNVFPVADKDTGTNLASMMQYIVDNLSLTLDTRELLNQLSEHGLIGSSGNSGLIFSQFFYGLTQYKVKSKSAIKLQEFAHMIMSGYKSAYMAVSQPKPGTILTVMEHFALSCLEVVNNTKATLTERFQHTVERARAALLDTINQLEVLRQNKVVDAGAKAFVLFIEGMLLFLKADPELRLKLLDKHKTLNQGIAFSHEGHDLLELPNYNYCFELVIKNQSGKSIFEKEREYLADMGDSIVFGHASSLEKLHIHTSKPQEITEYFSSLTEIVHQKIDDMKQQYNIALLKSKDQLNNTALVVDTLADIPEQFLKDKQITVIPTQVKANSNMFLDKYTINLNKTIEYLKDKVNLKTSAPSGANVYRSLNFLTNYYKNIVVLTVAKSLSSTFDVVKNQARKITNAKISVIDSKSNTGAFGLIVAYANSLIESSKYTIEEITTQVNYMATHTNIFIFINSLDELIRSGRLPKPIGFLARLLRVKPIIKLTETGKPKIVAIAFSQKGGWEKLIKALKKEEQQREIKSIALIHSGSSEVAHEFKDYVVEQTGKTPLYLAEASSSSVVHTGVNGVAIAYSFEEVKL